MHSAPDLIILDQLTTAVLLLSAELATVQVNQAAETLLGVGNNQLRNAPFAQFLADSALIQELRQLPRHQSSYTYRAVKLITPGNSVVTVDITATPLPSRQILLELQSVDRILQINREDALLSIQKTSRELVLGLAHEIRNPLGGIKGAAQLLALELPAEQQEYTDLIVAEVNRLSQLVEQLLGPARPMQRMDTNIHQICEHVTSLITAERYKAGEPAQKIRIERDYDPSIPQLHADKQQLIQALLNIVRNATEALQSIDRDGIITLRSRIQRHFTIGQQAYRTVLRLDIEDNGPGIPNAIMERIFYPMISGRAEGTGLGLHIAQTIISRHNGLIECQSQPGQTCFSVFLPFHQQG